tara:strand:- start:71 stop:448 length:378 start_codon:yes stop_codon:yes gene_type:complete
MNKKLHIRKVERYTIWEATEPIAIDVEKLRKCDPPYEGNTEEELFEYLLENIWEDWDAEFTENKHNIEVYGEDALYDLMLEEGCYETSVYSDSREKGQESWFELGVPNDEYRKTGGFESRVNNMY